MKVYKIQFEDIDNDCWGRTEYEWKDYDSNLYACEELAKDALKNIPRRLHSFRIKEVEVIDHQ